MFVKCIQLCLRVLFWILLAWHLFFKFRLVLTSCCLEFLIPKLFISSLIHSVGNSVPLTWSFRDKSLERRKALGKGYKVTLPLDNKGRSKWTGNVNSFLNTLLSSLKSFGSEWINLMHSFLTVRLNTPHSVNVFSLFSFALKIQDNFLVCGGFDTQHSWQVRILKW